jgi:autotransporter-associated beta strand protein
MNRWFKVFCLLLLAIALVAPNSNAANRTWTGATGDPLNGSTWNPTGALVGGDNLIIVNGTTASLTTTMPVTIGTLNLGTTTAGNGGLTINDAGTVTTLTSGTVQLGNAAGKTGTLTLTNGVLYSGALQLGGTGSSGSAKGVYIQDSGTATFTSSIRTGYGPGQTGEITVNGGTLTTNSNFVLAYNGGTAKATQTNGIINCAGFGFVGYGKTTDPGKGTYKISGGTFNLTSAADSAFYVGGSGPVYSTTLNQGIGVVDQSGGTVNVSSSSYSYSLDIGACASSYGYYKLSGDGTVKTGASDNAYIGHYSDGVMEQTGGTFNVGSTLWIGGHYTGTVGANASAFGVYTLTGGTAASQVTTKTSKSGIGGGGGTGVFTVGGTGQFTCYSTEDAVPPAIPDMFAVGGYTSGDTATLNLGLVGSGGGLFSSSTAVRKYDPLLTGQSDVNFHGGTLRALPISGANPIGAADFLQGTNVNVYAEGAKIDTNGVNITVTNVLQAPAGQGVSTTFTVTGGGTGYMAPPVVKFDNTGTGGSGATGYAVLTGGVVTSIVLTNPGTGYTSAPAITLASPAGLYTTQATATAALNAGNASGGVTKLGAGTLSLTGANTYTGTTTINAGALAADEAIGLPTVSFLDLDGGVLQNVYATTFTRSLGTSGNTFRMTANGGGFSAGSSALNVQVNGGAGTLVWGAAPADIGSKIVGPLKFGSTSSTAVTTFENGVDLNGADRAINVDENVAADTFDYTIMSGTIGNSGGTPAGFAKTGSGLLVLAPLSGSNTYNGDTVISGGALQANDGVVLPTGSLLKLDGGVLQADGYTAVIFTRGIGTIGHAVQWTANGGGFSAGNIAMNVRIGGNANAVDWGDAPADIGSKIVGPLKLSSTTANAVTTFENGIRLNGAVRTIQVDSNIGALAVYDWADISGLIADGSAAGGIAKTGAGTLVLSNVANSYTGVTTISAGTLEVPTFANAGLPSPLGATAATDASNLVIAGGSLRYTGTVAAATNRGFTTSGSARVENNSAEITFSGPIVSMPSTSFTKNSAGKLTFTNPGTNALATTATSIYNGILEFNGGSSSVYEIARLNLGINTPTMTAVIYQKSGTVKGTLGANDYWRMGGASGYPNAYAYYKLSGGTLDAGDYVPVVGYNGTGVFDQTGGAMTMKRTMYVGDQLTNSGVYNLFGGTCTVDSLVSSSYQLRIGGYGRGVFNIGGTGLLDVYKVYLGYAAATAEGILNLGTGGTIATRYVCVAFSDQDATPTYAKGTVNFHGGTMKALSSSYLIRNNAEDLYLNAYIYQEGAIIDTNGFAATMPKVLQTPEGAAGTVGVGGVTLSSVGAGYVGAPAVEITGGSGYGATAIASVDLEPTSATYGQVTGITITNPGVGYLSTDILTATLKGGGATTPAVPFAVTLNTTPNVSGGLTKVGLGTLTLSADNTFTGQVKVKAGTLAVATINDGVAGPLGNSVLPVVLGDTGGVTGALQYTGATATATRKFTMADGGTGDFQVATALTNLTLSSEIDGNGGLSKSGDGTLTLTAENSYIGATTVSVGTLALTATGQIAASSSIANAATFNVLDGTHTVNAITGAGTTNVYGTATLTAPSIVQGTLTIGGVAPTAAGAVPEPSTMVLLVLAGCAIVGTCLRRK